MSISSAPSATARRISASRRSSVREPDGNAPATLATLTPVPATASGGDADERRVDADGADRRHARVERVGPHGLARERADLAGRVGTFERREVDAADREVERGRFDDVLIDRPASAAARASSITRVDRGHADAPGRELGPRPDGGDQLDGHPGIVPATCWNAVWSAARRFCASGP